jgi:hypothetical protein
MKTGTVLVATLFAITSFPLLAQQAPPATSPDSPATQPSSTPMAQPDNGAPVAQPATPAEAQPASPPEAQPASTAAAPEASAVPATPAVEMRPVNAELESKLDSKTAKTGDDVVVQTKAAVKTADGTEIPKGSKLLGHVIAVQASAGGQNSQVALQFDHAELKGGQSVPIHSEIQSIAPAGGEASSSDTSAMSAPVAGGSASPNTPNGSMGSGSAAATSASAPGTTPSASGMSAAGNGEPAAGTVVARNGKIAIRAMSIPGVLLANNAPGEQDPRMGHASGILLGTKKDVRLEGGTQIVLGVAAAAAGADTK